MFAAFRPAASPSGARTNSPVSRGRISPETPLVESAAQTRGLASAMSDTRESPVSMRTYPLVAHQGTDRAMRGARTYLMILLSTSIGLLLLAILGTWQIAGTLDFREGGILAGRASDTVLVLLLALFAFGTGKAALMPFHRWLPAAMVAPTPVSALLHAVAVVKAGVFTMMKIVVYVFGLDLLRETDISVWLMYVAGGTIIIASLVALT